MTSTAASAFANGRGGRIAVGERDRRGRRVRLSTHRTGVSVMLDRGEVAIGDGRAPCGVERVRVGCWRARASRAPVGD